MHILHKEEVQDIIYTLDCWPSASARGFFHIKNIDDCKYIKLTASVKQTRSNIFIIFSGSMIFVPFCVFTRFV